MKRFFFFSAMVPLAFMGQEVDPSIQDNSTAVSEPVVREEPANRAPPNRIKACVREQSPMRTTLRHIEAGGIGYDKGYTSLDLFLGNHTDRFLPFVDLRGHYFNDGKWAANGGVGFRFLPYSNDTIFGFNLYYDYRRAHKTNFQQGGAGLEVLREGWEVRLNGYLPFGTKSSDYYDARFGFFKENHIYLTAKKHVAMAGGDAEIGYNIFTNQKNCSLFVGIGPYFYHPPCGSNVIGGRFRASAKWTDYLSADVTETYDNVFHNHVQGQLAVNFPFGPKGVRHRERPVPPAIEYRMVQPVIRDEIIVVGKCKEHPIAIDPSTGDPFFVLFVDNTSSSLGTFESPFNSFAQVESVYHPNDLIYVYPGDGTTTGMSSGITLLDNQQLLGSAVPHPITTQLGLITIPSQTVGFSPIIANGAGAVVAIANNNTVSGFYIQFLDGAGITNGATARTNLTATNNIFQGNGFNAIDLSGANLTGTVTIGHNEFDIGDLALALTSSSVDSATYSFIENVISTVDTTHAINLTYTDCSGITTNIVGNTILSSGPCINLTVSNASAPAASNTFYVNENDFAVPVQVIFPITLETNSNTVFTINSNQWQSVSHSGGPTNAYGIYVLSSGAATTSFSVNSNAAQTGDEFFNIIGSNTGLTTLALNSNNISSGANGVTLELTDTPFQLSIEANQIASVSSGISTTILGAATGTISVVNNGSVGYVSNGFVLQSVASTTNITSLIVSGNTISAPVIPLDIILLDNDTATVTVTGNSLNGSQAGQSGFEFSTSGITPLVCTGNRINSGGVGISVTMGTLNSPVSLAFNNNLIQAQAQGISFDSPAMPQSDFEIALDGNTVTSLGNEALTATVIDMKDFAITATNNTFLSHAPAFLIDASLNTMTTPISCTLENNHFRAIDNNVVKFDIAEAPFTLVANSNVFELVEVPPYTDNREQLLVLYNGMTSDTTGTVTIQNNQFLAADAQLSIALSTSSHMSGSISNNLFGLSGNAGAHPALSLATNDMTSAVWTVQGNTFEAWDPTAVEVSATTMATTCLIFKDNIAQPLTDAYLFTQNLGATFNVPVFTGNVPNTYSTMGTIGTNPCP